MRRRLVSLSCLSLILALGSSPGFAGVLPEETPVVLTAEERIAVIRDIKAQWSSARSEISTAAIKYRSGGAAFTTPCVAWDRLLPLMEQYQINDKPENLYELVREALNERSPPLRKERFFPSELYLEGKRIKVDTLEARVHALDEIHHYYFDRGNREIHLINRGQSKIGYAHPLSMRPVPPERYLDSVTTVERFPKSGLLQLSFQEGSGFERSTHLVHESTGLPYLNRTWDVRNQQPTWDTFLLNYVTFPEGVVFPTATIEFRYDKGMVTSYEAYLIDEAEFNVPIKPSDLAFSAPAKSFILDERNPDRLDAVTFGQDVPDVAYYVEHMLDFSQPPVVPPIAAGPESVRSHSMLLWINGIFLVAVGVFLWRFRSTGARSAGTN